MQKARKIRYTEKTVCWVLQVGVLHNMDANSQ
jgi:hypothetical protein